MSSPKPILAPIAQSQDTVLACYADTAVAVFLAGSFNDWSPTATPMKKDVDGDWIASLPLARGRYEYKFVVDGEWCYEPGCASETDPSTHCVVNEFGTMNRVLEV
jgi:1,4-alpha-glucan branching enzyme